MRAIIILLVLVVSVLGKTEVKQKESLPSGPIVTENSPLQLTDDPGNDINPFLLKGRDGNQYLFWQSDRGGNWGIYWKKYANGQWSETKVVISDSLKHYFPDAIIDSEGNIWLCYVTKDPEYTVITSSVTVVKFDGESWSIEHKIKRNNYGFWDCDLAIDTNDVIHFAVNQYSDDKESIIYFTKNNDVWNRVEYKSSFFALNPMYLLLPSTTNLPWLVWSFEGEPSRWPYQSWADFQTENGKWNKIQFERLGTDNTEWPDPICSYSATTDSLGNVFILFFSGWNYTCFFVKQLNSVNGDEKCSWVLDHGSSVYDFGRYGNFLLCSNRSSVGYTLYDNKNKQMYARLFNGQYWTIAQPVIGMEEKFFKQSDYTSYIEGNTIFICASMIVSGNYELILFATDILDIKDETIMSVEEFISAGGDFNSSYMDYSLKDNFPNPFNATTTLTWRLGKPGHVNISIYNLLGQKVRTLVDGYQADLNSFIKWHGRDDSGQPVSSGVYFARMQAGEYIKTIKMAFVE